MASQTFPTLFDLVQPFLVEPEGQMVLYSIVRGPGRNPAGGPEGMNEVGLDFSGRQRTSATKQILYKVGNILH